MVFFSFISWLQICLSLSYFQRALGQLAYRLFSLAWTFCTSLVPSGPKCIIARSTNFSNLFFPSRQFIPCWGRTNHWKWTKWCSPQVNKWYLPDSWQVQTMLPWKVKDTVAMVIVMTIITLPGYFKDFLNWKVNVTTMYVYQHVWEFTQNPSVLWNFKNVYFLWTFYRTFVTLIHSIFLHLAPE